MRNKGVAQLFL